MKAQFMASWTFYIGFYHLSPVEWYAAAYSGHVLELLNYKIRALETKRCLQ